MFRSRRSALRMQRFVVVSLLVALLGNLLLPRPAHAWKPTTHVFLAEIALLDALDNGKVTIHRVNYRTGQILGVLGEYAVDPAVLSALQNFPAQYRAGVLGPDAYPDIFTGQQSIHPSFEHTETPDGSDAWLRHLWMMAQVPDYDTPAIRAFTLGYLTHAAGDMFGHTFINQFSGGEFAITPPAGPENAIKHILLEGYVDKRMDLRAVTPATFDIAIDAGVADFIYHSLVDARAGTILGDTLLRRGAPGTEFSLPRIYSTMRDDLGSSIATTRHAADNCGFFDFTCSALILNLQADYMDAWVGDIDDGLQELPNLSHKLARSIFYNAERKPNISTALNDTERYAKGHLLSMSGLPDFVGLTALLIDDIKDAITPQALLDEIDKLKKELLNTLMKEALGVTTEDIKNYLTNPELYFDTIMNSGAGENVTLQTMNNLYLNLNDSGYSNPNELIDYTKVAAVYNTVTMSKLILLSQSEINRLIGDLGGTEWLYEPNIMLGFIPSLDGSLQWLNGMVFARDPQMYCQLFMLQPGETAPINCRPTANPDTYVSTHLPLTVSAANGVLANDSEPDGAALRAFVTTAPQLGALTLNQDGSFTYSPSIAQARNDSFAYKVSDGLLESAPVIVTLKADNINDKPVGKGELISTRENTVIYLPPPGLLSNDVDPDGDTLQAFLVEPPSKGVMAISPSGQVVYTPTQFYSGAVGFKYKVSDGILESDPIYSEIEIKPNPNVITAKPDTYIALKNRTLVVPGPGLLTNDSDRDGYPLQAADPAASQMIGGIAFINADGSFSFIPAANYFGEGEFSYVATDSRVNSNVSKVKILIRESNATPVAENDVYSTTNKAVIQIAAPGLLGNDWDTDHHPEYTQYGYSPNDPKQALLVSAPSKGTVSLQIDGSFVYTPGVNFTGRDSFTYKTSDGWDESAVATVRIADSALNQPPAAQNDSYQTGRNTQLVQVAPGLLANDSDADGDPLKLLLLSEPLSGKLKLNLDGSFIYSPTLNFVGVDSFRYSIADSVGVTRTATVLLTVTSATQPNQSPVAGNDSIATTANTAVTINVLGNDSDPDGDPLVVAINTQPTNGTAVVQNGQIVYTPQAGFTGADSFTYLVSDGKSGAATAMVTINVSPGQAGPNGVYLPLVQR